VEDEATTARAYGGALVMEVIDTGSEMVYKGAELLYIAITLWVSSSFIDKPKGLNSIEQELYVVNRRTKSRLRTRLGVTRTSLR
jgi:hypothetical protein